MPGSASTGYESVDFSSENAHGVLLEEDQENLKDLLEERHEEEVVDEFYGNGGWMNDWKAHRRSEGGVKLAVAYARALDLDEEEIKSYGDVDLKEVSKDHVRLAEDMHTAGKHWYREKFGDTAQMYRGLKDRGIEMIEAVYRDGSETVELSSNEIGNWTWDKDIALEWGRKRSRFSGALVRAELDVNDMVMTIDGLAGEYVNYHDSSVTYQGGIEVPKGDVSVELSGNSVREYDRESDDSMDRKWKFYEGSFFPWRPAEEQDLEALKSAAIQFSEENNLGVYLEGEAAHRAADMLGDVRQRLESELDPDDCRDRQVLDAARDAENRTRKWAD